jgi:hypothetical protein
VLEDAPEKVVAVHRAHIEAGAACTGFTLLPGKYMIKFLARTMKQAELAPIKPPSSSPT